MAKIEGKKTYASCNTISKATKNSTTPGFYFDCDFYHIIKGSLTQNVQLILVLLKKDGPEDPIGAASEFYKHSGIYSNVNVKHRCQLPQ